MAHNGAVYIPSKTEAEAEAVKEQILEKAKELNQLVETIPGAQIMIMGGAGTKDKLCSFQIGYATSQTKLMMLANLLHQLDPIEQMMFMNIMLTGGGKITDHSGDL